MTSMAHKSEQSACKGLSFIDWDDLNDEEYQKLQRIINSPSQCSGVQLPFSAECEKHFVQGDFEESATFQSVIPAPPIFIPVHWGHGDPSLCPATGGPYQITVPGAYVFSNPALTAGGETTMPFMSPLTSGQPMFIPGVSGHHIPPHYHTAPMPQSEPVDLSIPVIRSPVDSVTHPINHTDGSVTPASPPHQAPLNQVSQGLVPVVTQVVSICHQSMENPIAPQVEYISQANIGPPLLATNGSEYPAYEDNNQDSIAFTTQSMAITGLPPAQRPPSIEFAGPLVFSNSPVCNNKQLQASSKASSVSNDVVNREVVIEMEDMKVSDFENSQQIEKQDTNICDSSRHSTQPVEINVSNSSLASSADTSTATHVTNSKIEQHSDVTDKDATSETTLKTTPPQPAKMWSSLFGNKAPSNAVTSTPISRPTEAVTAAVPNAIITEEVKSVRYWQEQEKAEAKQVFVPTDKVVPTVRVQNDPLAPKILEKLCSLPICHTPIVIQPRGLVNGSNTCFMNATLQVLMGCPPFVHMFRDFKNLQSRPGSCSSTPIFDSLVQFVNSFQDGQRIRNQGSRGKKNAYVDINVGQPFSPAPLLSVAQSILGLHIGVQHDAEEFLSQILMICHEELENVMKLRHTDGFNNNEKEHNRNGFPEPTKNEADKEAGDDDESWLKVGPKNHHVETNVNDCGQTPLSSIFAGLSRSCLVRESGKTSDTVDSFFTLKLDIQAEGVHSVQEALLKLNTTETVHDADGGKVQGQRRMFFDVLPPVLIMHLKLFQYSNGNGQKIQKKIDFDVDLVIPKETLSWVGKTKLASIKSRTYKLFGVVNHHGMRMNDGHYTSDVYLPVANGWLHFDDSEVTHIHESQVLQYSERRMPYLLFYRRMDL